MRKFKFYFESEFTEEVSYETFTEKEIKEGAVEQHRGYLLEMISQEEECLVTENLTPYNEYNVADLIKEYYDGCSVTVTEVTL